MNALVPLVLLLTACPPELTGTDQVPDENILNTTQHDAVWNYASNPAVDAIMDDLLDEAPGCGVGIMVDGEIDYLHGYGWADPSAAPGGDTTTYTELGLVGWGGAKKDGEYHVGTMAPIGSVSKPFTAVAAMQLVEAGAWTTSKKVSSELTTPNTDLANLTVEDLLSHNKAVGVDDSAVVDPKDGKAMAYSPNFEDILVLNPMYEPRLAFQEFDDDVKISKDRYYSNVGYAVLGAMIDQYSHDHGVVDREKGYEKWVWTRVGEPYGLLDDRNMSSMALLHSWRETDIPQQTSGYQWDGASWDQLHPWDEVLDADACLLLFGYTEADCNDDYEGWEGPAGGWMMTVGDLTRFAAALEDEAIISRSTFRSMQPRKGFLPGVGDYGLGWQTGPDRSWKHDGKIGENTAHLAIFPKADTIVSLTKNKVDMGVAIQCNGETTEINPLMRQAAIDIHDHYFAEGYLRGASEYTPGELWFPGPPVGPIGGGSVLSGTTFELELDEAYVSSPDHLRLPLVPDTSKVPLLGVSTASTGELQTRLAVGTVSRGTATQDSTIASLDMGTDAFASDPSFSGSSTSAFELPTASGDVILEQPSFTLHAIDRGTGLAAGTLSGQLDLRSVPSLGTSADRAEVCRDHGTRGLCEPCDDGAAQCLSVSIDNVRGTAVSGTIR